VSHIGEKGEGKKLETLLWDEPKKGKEIRVNSWVKKGKLKILEKM
jgi:hypothetical protein